MSRRILCIWCWREHRMRPRGVKGISLFLVPKIRVEDDGTLGEPNNIALAGLNYKMAQRGTTNTLLNFGEGGECLGYLVRGQGGETKASKTCSI